jgi:hypothetical protein
MRELPFRQCSSCTHIEDCPEPFVDQDGKPLPPETKCPHPDNVSLNLRIRDMLPHEYFNNV